MIYVLAGIGLIKPQDFVWSWRMAVVIIAVVAAAIGQLSSYSYLTATAVDR